MEGELDCSSGRIGTNAAAWVGTGSKIATVQNKMHPQHMHSFVIRHKALRGQVNPIYGKTVVNNELGAQFDLHQRPSKEKITIPASMS